MSISVINNVQHSTSVQWRVLSYWLTGIGLMLGGVLLRDSTWQGSAELHTLMESISILLAFMVGGIALIRHYSKKNSTYLIMGAGFIGTACLDGYHALITSTWFSDISASGLSSLIPWSSVASRLFLAVLLYLSWALWKRQQCKVGNKAQINENVVYLSTAVLTILSIMFFAFVPLPSAYYPQIPFQRPEEFVPALFFGLALVGYLKKGLWRNNSFEHWLVLALIINLIIQLVYIPFSSQLFDMQFNVAHILKKVSYICVLIGLFINMYVTFWRVEQEVARRIRAELAQHSSDIRYKMIFDTMVDGVITTDDQGMIETVNPAAQRIFGYSAKEVWGKNVSLLMPEPHRNMHDEYIERFKTTGERGVIGIEREIIGRRKDGSLFPIDIAVNKMHIGNQLLFNGIVRDITERKQAESRLKAREQALIRSNKELERFAFVASHDLQEPLRKVQAFGGILKSRYENVLDDQGLDYIERMQAATGRMSILIEDLLLFSRISAQGQTFEQVNLNEVIAGVLLDLEVRITETDAKIEVGELPTLDADPMQMRQLFQNLIGNALKFRRADFSPVVRVSAEVVDQQSADHGLTVHMYRILVQDNGIGFDSRYLDKIFQVFQRLHGQDEYDGTGVGLAICRRIAERHGGALTAKSRPGKGATFIATLKKTHDEADQGEKAHVP